MPAEAFIDTSVLVYSVSSHRTERAKRDRARALLAQTDFGTSAQVLGEFYVTVTRKIERPLSEPEALRVIRRLVHLPVVAVDSDLVLEAIALCVEHQLSYWDGAIIGAAHRLARQSFTQKISVRSKPTATRA
jgi:predicted nucleic acid-binding protein